MQKNPAGAMEMLHALDGPLECETRKRCLRSRWPTAGAGTAALSLLRISDCSGRGKVLPPIVYHALVKSFWRFPE